MTDPKWENGKCSSRLFSRPNRIACVRRARAVTCRRPCQYAPASGPTRSEKQLGLDRQFTVARCGIAGTERCLEVLRKLQGEGKEFDIVVNIQARTAAQRIRSQTSRRLACCRIPLCRRHL